MDKALPTTKQMQMIDSKKFTAIALTLGKEAFVIYIAYLRVKISIYLVQKAQMALFLAEKDSVSKKYADFSDVFFKKSVAVLSNRSNINKQTIDPESDKQLLYKLTYSLGLVELENFKIYIKTNLANRFIQSSKSPAGASIFFV